MKINRCLSHRIEKSYKIYYKEQDLYLKRISNKNNDHERQIELINRTDRRYWIRSSSGKPIAGESRHRLKEVFAEQLEWVGPVYQNPNEMGRNGLF